MSIQTFITDKEFKQAAINAVAQMVSDYAAEYISEGNVADIGEQTLEYLEQVASSNQLSPYAVNAYYQIIFDENENIREFYENNRY